MATDETSAELFRVTMEEGAAQQAMRIQLEAWSAQGRALSAVARQSLLDQAAAVDMALVQRRPTAVTSANLALLEVMRLHRLLEDAPPPPDSTFDAMVKAWSAADAPADPIVSYEMFQAPPPPDTAQ